MGQNVLKILVYSAIAAIVAFSFINYASSQESVSITAISGSPKIMKSGSNDWTSCSVGDAVENGDRFKTASGESINIAFSKKGTNIISINENSDVVVRKGSAPYSIELLSGEVFALMKKLPSGSTFEVRTPAGLSGARGTGWGSWTNGNQARFSSFENSIYARGIDQNGNPMEGELAIGEGLQTIVDRFERPSRLEALSNRDMERWSNMRENMLDNLRGAAGGGGGGTSDRFDRGQQLGDRTGGESNIDRLENISESRIENKIIEKFESSGGGSTSTGFGT